MTMKPRTFPLCVVVLSVLSGCARSTEPEGKSASTDPTNAWQEQVRKIIWVAYSPSTGDPNIGLQPKVEEIVADLHVLRSAGFTGLVTYGMTGIAGKELPRLAEEAGFRGLIVGIWDPKSNEELATAKSAASRALVLGFCVGNEGLGNRYSLAELKKAIQGLRASTGKNVTTTQPIDDYYQNDALMKIGDWVFPNAHPYFHGRIGPQSAVRWTKAEYDRMKSKTRQIVIFKEVGLPTAGDKDGDLSEVGQDAYYVGLTATDVPFVYFEAFDLTWKRDPPVEPHWGLFRSNRTPKPVATRLMGKKRDQ